MNTYIIYFHIIIIMLFIINTYALYRAYKNTKSCNKCLLYSIYRKISYFGKNLKKNDNFKEGQSFKNNLINASMLNESNYFAVFIINRFYDYIFLNKNHKRQLKQWLNEEVKEFDNIMDILIRNKEKYNLEFIDVLKENFDRVLNGETFIICQKIGIVDKELYCDLEFIPMLNKCGEIDKVLVIMNDVTEHVYLQKEIIKSRNEAVRLQKDNSDFITYISHEIRTSTNSIVGLSDILLKLEDNRIKHNYMKIINNSSNYLINVLNDILDIAKLESNEFILHNEVYSFNEIILILDDIFYSYKKETGTFFKFKIDENLPDLMIGDSYRLKQILINLITNAFKYTNNGLIQLRVVVEEKHNINGKSYGRVRFEVSDSGVGIPSEALGSIFNKYAQVMETNCNSNIKGTGLGLTISKALVEAMGGSIGVKSKANEGTTFYFTIPFEAVEDSYENLGILTSINKKDINILIADDNEVNQTIIKSFVELRGWNSYIVDNGRKVLDQLANNTYHLILMDFHMPIMNGIETAKIIKKDHRFMSIPIIGLTAAGYDEYMKNSQWFDGYISKPCGEKDMNFLINKLLRFSMRKSEKSDIEDSELINFNIVEEMVGGDIKVVLELSEKIIAMFSTDEINKLRLMIENNEIEEIEELIHKLKGAVLNFKLEELVKVMNELVTNIKESDKQKIEKSLINITQEIEKFKEKCDLYKNKN